MIASTKVRNSFFATICLIGSGTWGFTAACSGTNGDPKECNDICAGSVGYRCKDAVPDANGDYTYVCDQGFANCGTVSNVLAVPPCPEDPNGDTGSSGGSPVDPGSRDIYVNAASGNTVVDRDFLDDLLDGTLPLVYETTTLSEQAGGGYELDDIDSGSLADELGFQDGDVIHEVNNISVDSVDYFLDIYEELETATTVDVEFDRNTPFGGVVATTLTFEIQ